MAKKMNIEQSTVINALLEDVWRVSALDFEHIARWDGNVKSSSSYGNALDGASVGGRTCAMYKGGETVEKFAHYDAETYTFSYDIIKGLPGFVTSARNTWIHEPIGDNKTKLTMRVDLEVKGILGTIMQTPMKSQMGRVLSQAQEELKHFIETGQPHPRKKKKMQKNQ